jgi:hypothetical protein
VATPIRPARTPACLAVEVVSVIVSGVLGLGGLAFGWWNRWLSVRHDRTLADLAAVRDVIERGAIHLHRVAYALDPVKLDLEANAIEAHAALGPLGRDYDELVERLKVRLGRDHEVVREFAGANEATVDAFRAVGRVVNLHLPHIERGGLAERRASGLRSTERTCSVTRSRSRLEMVATASLLASARSPAPQGPEFWKPEANRATTSEGATTGSHGRSAVRRSSFRPPGRPRARLIPNPCHAPIPALGGMRLAR